MIYTVTLNPAVDKILFLDEFLPSRTNRLSKTVETLGGKGTHVSIDLKILGVQSTALGITLGTNGRKIISMLSAWGVDVRFLHYDLPGMESRTNYELVEQDHSVCSMLTERGPILPVSITDDLLDQVKQLLTSSDTIVLTGDASNIEDRGIYSKFSQAAKKIGARVVLDASGPYLREGLSSRPFMIKPNYEELCFLAGHELEGEDEIIAFLQSMDMYGIPMIVMTWSGQGAIVKCTNQIYRVFPLKVDVKNEVGCGDAFLSAILAGIEKDLNMVEILKLAAGVAGSAAETEITSGFDLDRAMHLKDQVVVKQLR